MLEPVLAIVIAWAWLGESLNPVQVSGAGVTLAGVALALSAR
jgi:drug/metabolite transporter (DMT)-like permease